MSIVLVVAAVGDADSAVAVAVAVEAVEAVVVVAADTGGGGADNELDSVAAVAAVDDGSFECADAKTKEVAQVLGGDVAFVV